MSNLLHSPKWDAQVVEDELWQQADQQVHTWQEQGEDALVEQSRRACLLPTR